MSKPVLLALSFLLLISLACNLARVTTPGLSEEGRIATSVAQTSTAIFAGLPQPSQTQAAIPETATVTSTTGPTDTPTITLTPTLSTAMVSVTTNTNCRYGPGPDYHIVGALVIGQKVEVKGKDRSGIWWYIENPNHPGEFCWVWGQYAQVEGDQSTLAVVTPPPAYFALTFAGMHTCSGHPVVIFQVKNIGTTTLESGEITVDDTEVGGYPPFTPRIDNALFMAGFCDFTPGQSALAPGETKLIGAGLALGVTLPPAGHKMRADIKLCTQDGEGGVCISRSNSFDMPAP